MDAIWVASGMRASADYAHNNRRTRRTNTHPIKRHEKVMKLEEKEE